MQGAKNSALPILAAAVVTGKTSVLKRCPRLRDTDAAIRILRHIGCEAAWVGRDVIVRSDDVRQWSVDEAMMREMRSSIIFLGAILARFGRAEVSTPGGCDIGMRPIDLHLSALRDMGVQTQECGGRLLCTAPQGLRGGVVTLPFPSVGATENRLLCAVCAKGETVLHGAAREPEIVSLQEYLRGIGVKISGAGSGTVSINGTEWRDETVYTIPGDRIVASTLACACAAAGGRIILSGADSDHFSTVLHFLNEAGCDIINFNDIVEISSDGKLSAPGHIITAPYPGFPTDAQPILMAALLRSQGTTRITETIFENRFRQAGELRRLGGDIAVSGTEAVLHGVKKLHGDTLTAPDLRGGAAMIVAGLHAEGETIIIDAGHIARGYERFDDTLCALGADVWIEHK